MVARVTAGQARFLDQRLVCRAGVHSSQTSAARPDNVQSGSWPGFIDARLSESKVPADTSGGPDRGHGPRVGVGYIRCLTYWRRRAKLRRRVAEPGPGLPGVLPPQHAARFSGPAPGAGLGRLAGRALPARRDQPATRLHRPPVSAALTITPAAAHTRAVRHTGRPNAFMTLVHRDPRSTGHGTRPRTALNNPALAGGLSGLFLSSMARHLACSGAAGMVCGRVAARAQAEVPARAGLRRVRPGSRLRRGGSGRAGAGCAG